MKSIATTVTTSATLIVSADNKERTVYLHSGTGSVYIGGSNVTSSTGLHLPNGSTLEMVIPINETLYGITSSATQTLITLTPDTD